MINIKYLFHPSACGYFCLKYILKRVKVKDKKYMSLYDIGKILNENNYNYKAYKIRNIKSIKNECITLIKVNKLSYHYVIIKRISDSYVYYYDPLFLFIRKKKIKKFENIWFNVCLFYYR